MLMSLLLMATTAMPPPLLLLLGQLVSALKTETLITDDELVDCVM